MERSYAAVGGEVGSPGFTSFATGGMTPAPVPEPGTAVLLLAGLGLLTVVTMRRNGAL